MSDSEKKTRINGSLMPSYQNETVCLLGNVNHVDPNGNFFQMTTSDNQKVVVRMNEPIKDMLDGLVEVIGVVTRNEIQCTQYISWNHMGPKPFDMGSYDKAIQIIQRYKEHYITM
ncbi:hypothetical protein HELRODRAFT_181826 [Helobdella robusta]|uniref:Replication protein A 14 kDa subunit n=1 Tax=Helobdella robusta TaxID=6412 RepID=T1FHD6_HELRO|nr:hypothetical protein HELRODRAFT_181826 [Helobdella robusta]ESN92049.1 hypothetical protein HELRODRAFT_181826 [Helobdella robusta]